MIKVLHLAAAAWIIVFLFQFTENAILTRHQAYAPISPQEETKHLIIATRYF